MANVTARMAIMGQIDTVEENGEKHNHPIAILLEFESIEDIRKAIKDGTVDFGF